MVLYIIDVTWVTYVICSTWRVTQVMRLFFFNPKYKFFLNLTKLRPFDNITLDNSPKVIKCHNTSKCLSASFVVQALQLQTDTTGVSSYCNKPYKLAVKIQIKSEVSVWSVCRLHVLPSSRADLSSKWVFGTWGLNTSRRKST